MKIGVLLINLGTPRSYEVGDVKNYLKEFLMDPYVIDLPWILRSILVKGLIVPTRYKESAHLYKTIWTNEGSPLMVHGKRVQEKLQNLLGDEYIVDLAMRYQELKISERIEYLQQMQVKKIVFIPLFPQYAEATTGSIVKEIIKTIKNKNFFPEFKLVTHFESHPKMIEAFVENIKNAKIEEYDHLLLSFHGLPVSHLKKIDTNCLKENNCCQSQIYNGCYRKQCYATANAITKMLKIDPEKVSISFQSRLGKQPWIKPYTIDTAKKLLENGKRKILVACPAFVADCIETLSEIAIEYEKEFKKLGGEKFTLVPSLNEHTLWIEGLKELVIN